MAMRKSKKQGFSLVEVVLALAVMAFAFVAILGLIPAGMSSFRQAINISVCSQIGQRVIADAFQGDYDTLMEQPGQTVASTVPFLSAPRYFDEEGNEIPAAKVNANPPLPFNYCVSTKIDPSILMPGAISNTKSTQTAIITVQVVFDPAQIILSSQDYNAATLLVSSTRIPAGNVLTYYAHITRN